MKNVIVPLNAFDRFQVLANGQAAFVEPIARAGAYGVEIRRELLPLENLELGHIKSEVDQFGLFTVYSAPIECWNKDYQLNQEQLSEIFQEGDMVGARWIKVSLGHFLKAKSNVSQLAVFLREHQGIHLLVENDQTPYGGRIENLQAFFESAQEADVPVKMTFDVGNWYYSGQDVVEALQRLEPYILYLHLKQVEVRHDTMVTVPLEREGNHSWKKVLRELPTDIVKALEFPIVPKEETKEFIDMLEELEKENEVFTICNH